MSSDYEIIRQLYIEKVAGIIDAADEHRLQSLVDKDEYNRHFYDSLVREKEVLGIDSFLSELNPEKELAEIKRRIRKKKMTYSWLSTAAAILVLVGAGLWYLSLQEQVPLNPEQIVSVKDSEHVQLYTGQGETVSLNSEKDSTISVGDLRISTSGNSMQSIEGDASVTYNTLVVPAKLDYNVTLSDGTKVFLNSKSRLRFPAQFQGKAREIYLEGEAYLEVAKNREKPFIVHTQNADIEVLGTSFNVNTYNSEMKTALVEGAVLLTAKSDGKSVKLKPGIQANYRINTGFSTQTFDAEDVLSWKEGVYYFRNVKLKELEPVILRWFDMSFGFDSNKYSDLAISGLIEKEQLDAFLKDLETSAEISYEITGKEIRFK